MVRPLVIARVFPPRIGGSGNWMRELYGRAYGDERLVAAGHCPGEEDYDAASGLPTIRLPLDLASWGAFGWRRGVDYLRLMRQLEQVCRLHDADSIHAACSLPEGFLAWLLHRRLGLPYVVFVHGEELNVVNTSRELRWMTRRALSHADLVIANSRNTARLLAQGNWPVETRRLEVVSPGVDGEQFAPTASDADVRRRLGWENRLVVLTVGRLQRRKGHALLVATLPRLRERFPRLLYAIAGGGDQESQLRVQAEQLGVADHVQFLGELSGDRLRQAYQQCDLFALPNYEADGDIEGFGIVVLEAQACGKAVVVGDSGGTPETTDAPRTGRVVDCTDSQALAGTLIELLEDDQLRAELGAAARRWVEKEFDWSHAAHRATAALSRVSPRRSPVTSGAP